MTSPTKPEWVLGDEWAIARAPYNWILLKNTGKSWKKYYYASSEQLLKSLYRKITRTEPAQPDLAEYLKACLEIAQTFSGRFYAQTGITVATEKETPHNAAKNNTDGR